jgi:hypothetical protein
MGTMFANAPIVPTCVEVQVDGSISMRSADNAGLATTSIRPVDAIGSAMVADLYVCEAHAGQLLARARNREISIWPP